MSAAASPVVAQSTWTFTQGFLFGQASFLVIILVFIRYFVFAQAEEKNDDSWKKRRAEADEGGSAMGLLVLGFGASSIHLSAGGPC